MSVGVTDILYGTDECNSYIPNIRHDHSLPVSGVSANGTRTSHSVRPSVSVLVHQSIRQSASPSVNPYVSLLVHQSIHMSVY